MPLFRLHHQIPGIQVLEPDPFEFVLNQPTSGKIRLTDGLLWMPANESITVTGHYTAGELRLTADLSGSAPTFLGQQLRLIQLTLVIAISAASDGSGDQVLNTNAQQPVTATGVVRWQGDTVALLLNDSNGAIDLNLSYSYAGGGESGFQVTLAQPVVLDRVSVELESGRLRVDALPEETTLLLTLAGDARLIADGTFIQGITETLGRIFGAASIPSLDPPKFVYQHKFHLNGNLTGPALEQPQLSLLPDWGNGSTPTVDTFEGIDVALGRPRFTFELPAIDTPLPALALSLQNSTLRLLALPGWDALDFTGNLGFQSGTDGDWSFRFEPVLAGMASLPDFVSWLFEQLRWPVMAFPFLEDLIDRLLSLAENEWYVLFKGLLNVDPAIFTAAFDNLINGALATYAPFAIEDLFALAFRALQPAADVLYPLMWQNWFGRFVEGAFDQLLVLLQAAVNTLDFSSLTTLFDTLFETLAPAHLGPMLNTLLAWGAGHIETAFGSFLELWLPLFASAIRILEPDALAGAIWHVLQNATGPLTEFRSLADLPAFQLPSFATTDLFKLRTDVVLIGTALQGLALRSDWLGSILVFSDTSRFFDHLAKPFKNFLGTLFSQFPQVAAGEFMSLLLAFFSNAEGDEASETLLLQFGRFYFLGILMAVVAAAWNGIRPNHLVPWANLVFNNIEEDSTLNQKRLDPPGKDGRKYLIFSDIHRDEETDNRGPMNFGSIHHFSVHRDLYLKIFEYADDEGYTIIEAGDGEELWFVRDFDQYDAGNRSEQLLQSIIAWHADLYAKQKKMHAEGRFYRIIGNHDSQLRESNVRQHLEQAIGESGSPLTLYDFLIIPQVKTMDDGFLDIVLALMQASTTEQRVQILRDQLVLGRIGLDSHPYTATKPMIVAHGHQWDFWNCDANNLVGKLFANAVGVTFDMLNDPFTDMGGINYGGAALVNFRRIFADLFVFNNFPTHVPARKFAHDVQHQQESERFPIDDVMFIETLPALMSYLTMPLNHVTYNADGEPTATRTWTQFRNNPTNPLHAFDHLFNQLCIGHTHYPQAAPYFDIEAMLTEPLLSMVNGIRAQIAEHFFGIEPTLNLLKSRYYNSGNAGWHEGVIWAIEINEHGEARVVYWTEDTRIDRPQTMDWQLPRMEDAMRELLDSRKAEVEAYLAELMETMGDSLIEVAGNIGTVASMPLAFLAGLAGDMGPLNINVSDFNMLGTADLTSNAAHDYLTAQQNQITGWLITLFLRLMDRQVQSTTGPESFKLVVPLPGAIADALATVESFVGNLDLPGTQVVGDHITRMACIWLLANHGASIFNRADREDGLLRMTYPVAWMVISLIAMLPAPGAGAPLSAGVATQTTQGTVRLEVTVTLN